jgi:hypothetical protein
MSTSTITTMFLVLTRELNSVPRYRLLNLIAPAQSNGERYSVGSSAITIEPLIVLSFPPLEISPSQRLFFTQCSSVSKRAYSTKPHAFLQYFIPKFKLCKIILDPLKGGGFFSPPISVGWSFYRIRPGRVCDEQHPIAQTYPGCLGWSSGLRPLPPGS